MAMQKIPEIDRKGLRQFGLLTGTIVAVLFGLLLPWLLGRQLPLWPWVAAGALLAWALTAPGTLRPVYRIWMRFGLVMSRITTPLLLGAVFLLTVLPTALILRLRGKDPMARTFDADARSYRVPSEPRAKETLERPF
jgi:hypothetical protein